MHLLFGLSGNMKIKSSHQATRVQSQPYWDILGRIIMYGIAITYAVISLLLLGGFAYLTFKMTSKKWLEVYLN